MRAKTKTVLLIILITVVLVVAVWLYFEARINQLTKTSRMQPTSKTSAPAKKYNTE
ncbi:hypothetical protein BH10BAC3_BH10BAC3_29760 [soil metagenome]